MSMPRGRTFVITYLVLLGVAYALVFSDLDAMLRPTNHVVNLDTMRLHLAFLGVLGLPWSALFAGCAIGAAKNGGISAGFAGGANLLGAVILAPPFTLAGIAWFAWRRRRRGGVDEPPRE